MTTTQNTATAKQINFALSLMSKKGIPTNFMCAKHGQLGAGMRERSGKVQDWVARMSVAQASDLIDRLIKL